MARLLVDVFEQAALMRGIGLHGLDQIGDEIGAPAQLHVDAAPALAHDVALAHQPVEDDDGVKHDRDDDRGDHPVVPIARIPVCLRVAPAARHRGRRPSRSPPDVG